MKKCAGRDLNPRVRTHWCLKPAPWTSRAPAQKNLVPPGFEPGMWESKSQVLPLHYGTRVLAVGFEPTSDLTQKFLRLPP